MRFWTWSPSLWCLGAAGSLLSGAAAQNGLGDRPSLRQRVIQHPPQVALSVPASHRPWIWAVESPTATIWMAGVLHLAGREEQQVFRPYLAYYEASRAIYFETAPGAWDSYTTRRMIEHRGMIGQPRSLAALVAPATWAALGSAAQKSPGIFPDVTQLQPWMASVEIERASYRKAGLTVESSLERHLLNLAIKDHKPVGSLENPVDQIAPLANLPRADQEAALLESIHDFNDATPILREQRRAWLSGDLDSLRRALRVAPGQERSTLQKALIDQRNDQWLRRIAKLAKEENNVLLVVGIEHLVTPVTGLPDRLEKMGISVRRVD